MAKPKKACDLPTARRDRDVLYAMGYEDGYDEALKDVKREFLKELTKTPGPDSFFGHIERVLKKNSESSR